MNAIGGKKIIIIKGKNEFLVVYEFDDWDMIDKVCFFIALSDNLNNFNVTFVFLMLILGNIFIVCTVNFVKKKSRKWWISRSYCWNAPPPPKFGSIWGVEITRIISSIHLYPLVWVRKNWKNKRKLLCIF